MAVAAAQQSLEPLLQRKRWRRSAVNGRLHVHQGGKSLLDHTPAAIGDDQAHWLSARSQRLRDDAEVTRIESANVR